MELYIIISLFFIAGGVRVTESNDRCYVPVACLDGRKAWIDVPNEEKLPVSLLFPNYCKVDELCKKKMEETQKALDNELRTLEKQYTGVKELLEQKMKTRNRTITRPAEKPSKPGTTTTTKPSIEISSVEGDTTTESDGCGSLYNNSTSIVCRDNPTARDDRCEWTGWYNRDEPTTAEDNEELLDLRKEKPGQICEHPTCIEARVANTKQPYTETGDIVHISPCNGFLCINADQPGCPTYTPPVCCKDYEVRFCCPTET